MFCSVWLERGTVCVYVSSGGGLSVPKPIISNRASIADPCSLPFPPTTTHTLTLTHSADITSNTYYDWLIDHAWILVPAQAYVAKMIATLKEFPPRQKAASFTVDQMLAKLQEGMPSS